MTTNQAALERRIPLARDIPRATKRFLGPTTAAATPVVVRTHGTPYGDVDRDYIRERLGFKLGKFALGITSVSIRVEDVSGPHGAPTFGCLCKVNLRHGDPIVVEGEQTDVRASLDDVADRTERAVRRALSRSRTMARAKKSVRRPQRWSTTMSA